MKIDSNKYDFTDVKHPIKKHILSVLMTQRIGRFRDMRPPKADTNLYSYHLAQLLKSGYVKKTDDGYTLDTAGLIYADRLESGVPAGQHQPRTEAMMVIQNGDGGVLLQKVTRQPYIDRWMIPSGKVLTTDSTMQSAARRVVYDRLKFYQKDIRHAGDCYIRVHYGDTPLTVTLAHIFAFESDDIEITGQLQWVQPHKLQSIDLVPGTEEIIARTFFRDPFYFEEYAFEW